jgi:hypothetical protein
LFQETPTLQAAAATLGAAVAAALGADVAELEQATATTAVAPKSANSFLIFIV